MRQKNKRIWLCCFSFIIGCIALFLTIKIQDMHKVFVTIQDDQLIIGNDFLSRKFTIQDKKIKTSAVQNNRANTYMIPAEGSQDFVIRVFDKNETKAEILSSEMTYEHAEVKRIKNGKQLKIEYNPCVFNNVIYDIDYIIWMEDGKHYMRSYLQISADKQEQAKIDSIEIDRFVLSADTPNVWSIPSTDQISSKYIGKHELMLGQPIYANGLFMGSEFPAAETDIVDHAVQIRYYSGKSFATMKEDSLLTVDGAYVSWNNVLGAADATNISSVQTEFYRYIDEIATPTEFRKQYNSWYDNMMSITDESIAKSFLEVEEKLSAEGIEPLDSYVVDDGWNNYYDSKYTAPSIDAGEETPNQTGFWEFNNKFPNELYPSSSLTNKLQSTFGLWVGPQGGYSYYNTFSKYLEECGTGFAQEHSDSSNVVCTGSDKYLKNWTNRFIDYQKRFNIGYWKWDGFAFRPCNNPDHDHMVGGENDMYFTSDMWEKWIDVFEAVRNAREEEGKELFINATCYVNLSPWLLQWVNTIWVQDSSDTGQIGTGERHEQKIYYRDQVYHQIYRQNQIQFPLKNIYNHDPIYGVSDKSEATTDAFREYLFANAVRGTAFWELYYSPSILDDAKWKVTSDALAWADRRFSVLQHAKLFGNEPKDGIYGYSSWLHEKGIISLTNPLDQPMNYEITFDENIGVTSIVKNAEGVQVYPYQVGVMKEKISYGDRCTFSLQPHETIIMEFNLKDNTLPEIISTQAKANCLYVKFSDRVNPDAYFMVNKEEVTAVLMDDYRTYRLIKKDESEWEEQQVLIEAHGVTDAYGRQLDIPPIQKNIYHDNIIAHLNDENGSLPLNQNKITVSENGFSGTGVMGIQITFATTSQNVNLMTQGKDIQLRIDKNGFICANIGSLSLSSKQENTEVVQKAHGKFGSDQYVPTQTKSFFTGKINDGNIHSVILSRQANGVIKLYVDGELTDSAYDPNKTNEMIKHAPVELGDVHLSAEIVEFYYKDCAFNHEDVQKSS